MYIYPCVCNFTRVAAGEAGGGGSSWQYEAYHLRRLLEDMPRPSNSRPGPSHASIYIV